MMASQTIEEKFVELENLKKTPELVSQPKIQKVACYRRKIPNLGKYYKPKLVSIGPIHHDNTDLKLGEKYKLMWAAEYIEKNELKPEKLHKKITDNIHELKLRFSDDVLTLTEKSLEGFGSLDEKLSWILFVDGCSLLHILEKARRRDPGQMNIKADQLFLVMVDVVLLENQLPYEVLKLLWKDNKESELIESMTNFFKYNHWSQSEKEEEEGEGQHNVSIPNESQSEKEEEEGEGQHNVSIPNESQRKTPTHLLDHLHKLNHTTSKAKSKKETPTLLHDLLHKLKLTTSKSKNQSNECSQSKPITYRGIEDLRAVGIRFKASSITKLTDIDFSGGWFSAKLTIPTIRVNNFTAAIFLNLVAYEMCPDFKNDYQICSYVALMDSLIDHPEDVKVLRSKGILCTFWSDEEVAKLFNIIGTDLVANLDIYFEVQQKLREHYFNKYKTWIALGFRTYFNNPWTVIAFLAAFIALALTFIQTLFTVHPACK